jgi:hypothetical protein
MSALSWCPHFNAAWLFHSHCHVTCHVTFPAIRNAQVVEQGGVAVMSFLRTKILDMSGGDFQEIPLQNELSSNTASDFVVEIDVSR